MRRKVLRILLAVLLLLYGYCCVRFQVSPIQFIGGAFCHQMPERSPFYPAYAFPFCFRCTGLFCGLFFGMAAALLFRDKQKEKLLNPGRFILFFAACALVLIDVLNGKTELLSLYPDNILVRLLSGCCLGFTMAVLIAPLFLAFYPNCFHFQPVPLKKKELLQLLFFLIGAGITAFLITRTSRPALFLAELLTLSGSLGFVYLLYLLLLRAGTELDLFPLSAQNIPLLAGILTSCQILTIGTIHQMIL